MLKLAWVRTVFRGVPACVRVCVVCACARACVCAHVCACVRACVRSLQDVRVTRARRYLKNACTAVGVDASAFDAARDALCARHSVKDMDKVHITRYTVLHVRIVQGAVLL